MRFPLVGLMFILLVSCGEKIPAGIISEKQMPDVLFDVHLADGQLAAIPIDSARLYLDSYYAAIFNRYGIDSTIFANSISYYSHRPRVMNEFYSVVEKRLDALNAAAQQVQDASYQSRRMTDSVQRVQRLNQQNRAVRDSLDYIRKKDLLFLHGTDTVYNQPVPVTYIGLKDRLWEQLGFHHIRVTKEADDVTVVAGEQLESVKPDTPRTIRPLSITK
ncbi:DUF4296 domain-containing protein [Parapedobacter lycopersici]|uniref:DUF4296 domain-containing protein n=1 Tax=Parapedobacter lycopersici TaxID=1864939 RepID=UPI00333E34F2